MSVRSGLMALLAEGEKYGAQLRSEFEARTGGTWPLNVGQVYTTLDRLVRDGLVESAGEPDAEGRIAYRLTAAGPRRARRLVEHPRRPHQHPARRADHQAGPGRHRPGRRRAAGRPDPAHRHPAPPARPHPAQAGVPRPRGGGGRGSRPAGCRARPVPREPRATTTTAWPGCSSSRTSSSPPRPRSAGSTTSRRCSPADPRARHPTNTAHDRHHRDPARRRPSSAAATPGGTTHEHRTARRHLRRHPHPRQRRDRGDRPGRRQPRDPARASSSR